MLLRMPVIPAKKILLALLAAAAMGLMLSLRYSMTASVSAANQLMYDKFLTEAWIRKAATTQDPSQCLTPSGVPKIIHFVYKDANVLMPYKDAFETCLRFNKDWTIVLWTDEAIGEFLRRHFPDRVKMFVAFPHKIQRADAIRYLILYKFGGVYMDLDMHCHRPLLPSLSAFGCFIDREREHQTEYVHGRRYSAMNSAMGCSPAHPFFRKVIDFVFHPDRLKQPFSFPNTIFITTGPAMLTNQYDEWQKMNRTQSPVTMLSETYFSPKVNPRSGIYGACRGATGSKSQPKGLLSGRDKVCWELKALGFEKSDDLFITNRTVAIHQFTHLGYHDQSMNKFNVTRDFPRVKSFFQLANSSHLACL